jgi:hypothetical protein
MFMNITSRFRILFASLLLLTFTSCYERPSAGRSSGVNSSENASGDSRSSETDLRSDTNDLAQKTLLDTDGTAVADTAKKVPFHTKLNLYIENSGSMNGYVNGNTTFKNALGDLLVYLKYEFGEHNIHLHFINDTIHPVKFDRDITQFAASLSPETMRVGNTASSDLNLIFNTILQNTDAGTVSILFSDLIYSIQGSNTEQLLNYQKSQTKDAFLSKARQGDNLQTAIVQLSSSFNGTYWDKNNATTPLRNVERPWYMTVTGEAERVADFNRKIDVEKMAGFENKFTLTTDDFSEDNYFSVLTNTYNEGRFKPIRSMSAYDFVRGIEDVEVGRGGAPFRFAVAVDLSRIPVSEPYKTSRANFEVLEGNYRIDTIFAIAKKDIQPSDWVRIESAGATHIVLVEAEGQSFSDLTIAMKKQIPEWVYRTDTEDDRDVEASLTKTFGFKYLVEGVSEAYETLSDKKDYYFELEVPVRKASASNTGKIIVVLLILATIAGLLYTYLKRKR